jgi:hypothetical protein
MTVRETEDSQKVERKLCPECSTSMAVVEQCKENGALFTWYCCARDDCDGQWLEKEILTRCKGARFLRDLSKGERRLP